MPATRPKTVIANDIVLVPANPQTFTWTLAAPVAGQGGYGADASISITNGATGPTVAAQVQPQHTYDGTNWYNTGGAIVGSVTANAVVSVPVTFPLNVLGTRFVCSANTVQNVTIRIEGGETTGI